MRKPGFVCVHASLMFALSLLLASCAGNGQSQTQQGNAQDILNGNTLGTANSHWVAQKCFVQVELTADGGAWTTVTDIAGTTSSASESWTQGPTSDSVNIGPGSGIGGFRWISALAAIKGSTSSKGFSAAVTVEDSTQTHQSLGSCSFTLESGGLP